MKYFTIKDLIEKLKELDENLIVRQEGCDCCGHWNGELTQQDYDYHYEDDNKGIEKTILLGRDD